MEEFGALWVTFEQVILALAGWTALTTGWSAGPITPTTVLARDHVPFLIDECLAQGKVAVLADQCGVGSTADLYLCARGAARALLQLPSISATVAALAGALAIHATLEGLAAIAVIATKVTQPDLHRARQIISDTVARLAPVLEQTLE